MKPARFLAILLAPFVAGAALGQSDADPSFATPQIAATSCDVATAVLGDNSILQTYVPGPTSPGGIAHVRGDGNLDAAWGSGGRTEWLGVSQSWYQILQLSGGRILVLGSGVAARLLPDGSVDTSYGSRGFSDAYGVLTPPPAAPLGWPLVKREFFSAALQDDESVVIAANSLAAEQRYRFVRLTRDGRIDSTFLREIVIDGSPPRSPYAWSVSADGTVQLGLYQSDQLGRLRLEVLSLSGVSAPTVVSGLLMPRAGAASWRSEKVKVDPHGNLYILGACQGEGCPSGGISLTKYDVQGQIDTNFGHGGRWRRTDFDNGVFFNLHHSARDLFLWADGSLTAAFFRSGSAGVINVTCSGACTVRLPMSGEPTFEPLQSLKGTRPLPDGRWVGPNVDKAGCVLKRALGDQPPTETNVVEYHHAGLDHYFMAVDGPETRGLDAAPQTGWLRTARSFGAWGARTAFSGSIPVCRFFLDAQGGSSGHFYSLQGPECESLRSLDAQMPAGQRAWRFVNWEFQAASPGGDGQCAPHLQPVYRAYNGAFQRGIDPNHRYSTDPEVLAAMQSRGWLVEGIAFCATLPAS